MTYFILKGIALSVLAAILVVASFFVFIGIAAVEFTKVIVEVVRDVRSNKA